MDGNLVIMDCSFCQDILPQMVALSYGRHSVVEIVFIPMHGSLVIMEVSVLSISLLL